MSRSVLGRPPILLEANVGCSDACASLRNDGPASQVPSTSRSVLFRTSDAMPPQAAQAPRCCSLPFGPDSSMRSWSSGGTRRSLGRSKALITSDEEAVIPSGQSSYCITPNLHELAASPYERLALVGLPCEIQALNKMRSLPSPPAVADKVLLTLELACSSSTRVEGTEHIVTELLDVDLDDVVKLKYRQGEYPGSFAVTLKDATTRALPFWKSVQTFSKFKTFRCRSCPDWWSGLADVSICDGDPNIFKTSRNGAKSPRCSMVVPRTNQGAALIRQAEDLGLLLVKPASFDEAGNMGLQRKRHRSRLLADRHGPDAVPVPPCAEPTPFEALPDRQVMQSLSCDAD